MPKLPPFNIQIMDVDDFIQRHSVLPVNTSAIFESGTRRFHPDGLFSEVIFGQVGSRDRLVRKGFIDLRTQVITPHLFKQLMTLKSYYQEILQGKKYAYFDETEKDLIVADMDTPGADTGYSFFIKTLPKIVFKQSDSVKRKDKIALIEKYRDRLLIDKIIVLPAGIRDVRIEDQYIKPEEVNKFYMAILSLREAMPQDLSDDPLYDSVRYQIQMKLMQIYDYITTLIDGKHGFAQGKFAARRTVYSSRNVITAVGTSRVNDPLGPKAFYPDEILLPLFQTMKSCMPLMVHGFKSLVADPIFANQTNRIPLISNSPGYPLEYVTVTTSAIHRFTTSDGINDLVNAYRNPEMHWIPATIQGTDDRGKISNFILFVVHDYGDVIRVARSQADLAAEYQNFISSRHLPSDELVNLSPEVKAHAYLVGDAAYATYVDGYTPEVLTFIADSNEIANVITSTIPQARVYTANFKLQDLIKQGYVVAVNELYVIAPEYLADSYPKTKSGELTARDEAKVKKLRKLVYSPKYVRPLSWTELFYLVTYRVTLDKTSTATRHPMLLIENMTLNRIHLVTTSETRIIELKAPDGSTFILPEYPKIGRPVKVPMSVHPAHLERYDGDHKPLWPARVSLA